MKETNFLKYIKIRNVHDLTRGTDEAAGVDFYVPEYDAEFMNEFIFRNPNAHVRLKVNTDAEGRESLAITLLPGSRVLIPSGIKVSIPKGTMLMAANKSGVSTKQGLVYTAEIIDSDYSGEIGLGMANYSDEETTIVSGQKLVQFVHVPIILSNPEQITEESFNEYHSHSLRGENGFGSGIETVKE